MLGAEGKQLVCYTNVKQANTPPKAPGGGGFGCEQFSLESLYTDYLFRKNVWTKTNILKDLCRYLGVTMVFYRHPETDFIVSYSRQPPFDISKEIYTMCHPMNMLLAKHKIIIPSKFTNPKGKSKIKKHIKPPKQMLTKWFFQEHFAHFPLVMIQASACNFNYNNLGCCNTNQMVTFFYLNINFYQSPQWGQRSATGYQPYSHITSQTFYTWTKAQWDKDGQAQDSQAFTKPTSYDTSVGYTSGWFSKQILQAVQITSSKDKASILARSLPVNVCRYNPNLDNGKKSKVWLVSTLKNNWEPPHADKTIVYEGYPLYMILYGFLSYVQYVKKAPDFFLGHVIVLQSDALLPASQAGANVSYIVPIDNNMYSGKAPYDEELTASMKSYWMPNIYNQLQVLNTIVESGPLVPKYSQTKNSTWELDMFYTFFLSGVDQKSQNQPLQIQNYKDLMKYQIPSMQAYKLLTRQNKKLPVSYTHGISDVDTLQKQLLKECKKTSQLTHLSTQMQTCLQRKRKGNKQDQSSLSPKKKRKKSTNLSSHSAKKISSKSHKHKRKTSSSSSSSSSSSRTSSSTTSSE